MTIKKIKLMISSRCIDEFDFNGALVSLTTIRENLKTELENQLLFGRPFIEVWINELAPAMEGTKDSWDACLKEVAEADIVLVIFNGNAGWSTLEGGIGICHAELMTALATSAGKVRLIELAPLTPENPTERDVRFREYVQTQSLFRTKASSGVELLVQAKLAILEAISHQVRLGAGGGRKKNYHLGAALDWTRQNFEFRKSLMEQVLATTIDPDATESHVVTTVGKTKIVFSIHAIPDAFSTAEARELVGRPFLEDFKLVEEPPLSHRQNYGPVHLIAIHKNMTESQARSFLGHPNVIMVNAPFGYYLADRIDHSQTLVLTDCRDEASTRHSVQRCFEWLKQSGESIFLAERAKKRKSIIREVARNQE